MTQYAPLGMTQYVKYATSAPRKDTLRTWAQQQCAFDRPVLVVWAAQDRVMPPAHGRRLAALFPHGQLVQVQDSYTLIPEDQPGELVAAIRRFMQENA